jgi:hypothetical protein
MARFTLHLAQPSIIMPGQQQTPTVIPIASLSCLCVQTSPAQSCGHTSRNFKVQRDRFRAGQQSVCLAVPRPVSLALAPPADGYSLLCHYCTFLEQPVRAQKSVILRQPHFSAAPFVVADVSPRTTLRESIESSSFYQIAYT